MTEEINLARITDISPQNFWEKSSRYLDRRNAPVWKRWATFARKYFGKADFAEAGSDSPEKMIAEIARVAKDGRRPSVELQTIVEKLDNSRRELIETILKRAQEETNPLVGEHRFDDRGLVC